MATVSSAAAERSTSRTAISSGRASPRRSLAWRSSLSRAERCLREPRDLKLLYQPQVRLADGTLRGFEALLRCRDERGRWRRPSYIIAGLHEPALSKAIGCRVRHQAFAAARQLELYGATRLSIAVNVSHWELEDPRWGEAFLTDAAAAGVSLDRIEVEVTESALLGLANSNSIRALRLLHDRGVAISLDDFGTGFASLLHLRDCPVNSVKIDRCFIQRINEARSAALVDAVIKLGDALRFDVIAEGVETLEQEATLKQLGCPIVQGFRYGAAAELPLQSQIEQSKGLHRSCPAGSTVDVKVPTSGAAWQGAREFALYQV